MTTIRPTVKKAEAAKVAGKSIRGLELMIKDGRFPKPFYLGDRSPRWRAEDIENWLAKMATGAQCDKASAEANDQAIT